LLLHFVKAFLADFFYFYTMRAVIFVHKFPISKYKWNKYTNEYRLHDTE